MEKQLVELYIKFGLDPIHYKEMTNDLFRLFNVSGSVCDECESGSGWYGDEDIMMNCSKCNPEAY